MSVLETSASARFFFNLVSSKEAIPDETGVNLSIAGDVIGHIARALEDLYQDGFFASDEWQGWRMVVNDCTGQTVLSIALGGSSPESNNLCTAPRDFSPLDPMGKCQIRAAHHSS